MTRIIIEIDEPRHPRRIVGVGYPITTNKQGTIIVANFELHSDDIAFFPVRVNGAVPDPSDVFTPTSNNPAEFTCEMGVVPATAPVDAGNPAVKVTCLTHDGMRDVSFGVSDSAGSIVMRQTFDIIPPMALAGTISVDEGNIFVEPNPNPPTA